MSIGIQRLGKQGKAVALFHGFGFNAQIFKSLADSLAIDYQVFLIDLPGCGCSPWKAVYQEREFFLSELHKQLPDEIIIGGWSLGGLLALNYAYFFPEVTRGLWMIASSPSFIQKTDWPGLAEDSLLSFSRRLHTNFERTIKEFLMLQCPPKQVNKQQLRQLQHLVLQNQPTKEALQYHLQWLKQDARQLALALRHTSLHTLGGLDSLVPKGVKDKIPEAFSQASVHFIDKAAHIPFVSHQEVVIERFKLWESQC